VTQLTRDGASALTPEYAAPEQITGAPVTVATDIYGLGVLLYVLLSGEHPAGDARQSPAALVKAIVETEPPRVSDVAHDTRRRSLTGDLDTIVHKALKKDPRERYGSAVALADDLRRYLLHEPIRARPDSVAYRAGKFVRRHRTALALSGLVVLAVVVGLVTTLVQARSARAQRDFAYHQLARAERINALSQFVLTDAAPSGRAIPVNKLLDQAAQIVERENYTSDLPSHVDLLITIGNLYFDRDDNDKSLRTLEQAHDLSRQTLDPSVRARASCALIAPLKTRLQYARAESLLREALGQLPDGQQYALDRIFCLVRGVDLAIVRGAAVDTIARAESADRLMRGADVQVGAVKLEVLKRLGAGYMLAARYGEAIAAYRKATSEISRLGYEDTRRAVSLLHDWAVAVILAGRPHEAERLFRRAIEIAREGDSEHEVPTNLLVDYSGALREVGRLEEAADYAERAYRRALETHNQQYLSSSLVQRARIYREEGRFSASAALLAELEPVYQRGLPAGHYIFGSFASERSLLAHSQGKLAEALALAGQAVTLVDAAVKSGGHGATMLPIVLVRRSTIELESGLPDAAAADAARALTLLQTPAMAGQFSENTGRALVALGLALRAQGKHDEARAAGRSAVDQLEHALGPDHVETREARRLADGVTP
jgi:serine/threonine-protein kinase